MGAGGPGRFVIMTGLVLVVIGLMLSAGGKVPLVGRLPGDFVFERGRFTLYLPLGTSLVVSLFLSIAAKFWK